jgi:hypothetical protein
MADGSTCPRDRSCAVATALAAICALMAACTGGAAVAKPDASMAPDAAATSAAPPASEAQATLDASVAAPTLSPGGDGGGKIVRAPLPEAVLGAVLGCWQLEDRERWSITRTAQGGARVVRTLTNDDALHLGADYARRVGLPSDLIYNPGEATLAFTTAGSIHGLLFIFTAGPAGIEGSWFSSRDPTREDYHWTGNRSTLQRCRTDGGKPR